MTDWMDEHFAESQQTLDRIAEMLTAQQFSFVPVHNTFGRSLALAFSETDFCVISVPGAPSQNTVYLISPVLGQLQQDRLLILDQCNQRTRDNPVLPVILHEAEAGWSALVSVGMLAGAFYGARQLLRTYVEALPTVASAARESMLEFGVVGSEYHWGPEALSELAIRSVL
jgi:hypothetical protein